jgi:glycosyltransferase involved in cell wall biosynthesis
MATKLPLVSVIITTYNYADYIEEAIASVFTQSYKNIELIIINDGSTDNTQEILKRYEEKAKILNQANQGIIATRNKGMELASGKYVMQLDADDYLDNDYVSKCVEEAEKGSDIIYTQVRHFGRTEFQSDYITYDLEKLKHSNYIHATSLIRRSVLSDNPYDSYLDDKGYEDWDLFLGLCLAGASASLIDEPLLNYRKHDNRKSRSDAFGGSGNELLARHHIWSKYNEKYSDEFWYFSSEIDLLYKTIEFYGQYRRLMKDMEVRLKVLEEKERYVRRIENINPYILGKKFLKKVRNRQ